MKQIQAEKSFSFSIAYKSPQLVQQRVCGGAQFPFLRGRYLTGNSLRSQNSSLITMCFAKAEIANGLQILHTDFLLLFMYLCVCLMM